MAVVYKLCLRLYSLFQLLAIGGLSGGIKDVWEMLGSQEETKYTWDTTTNDNLAWHHPLKYKPKLRFERVYIKHPWKQAIVEPISFELTGKTRLQSCHLFPSDHWAVVCQFNILPRRAA